ncbi:histidine phosphotransferase ChpT [Methylocystis parvus]|uniref:Histidine phosphotransferase n=1 Tax=Methylocystis parvus TaxID=134 RepID=A0A6B8M996_9HYPH|nr:histidine phosphotransferase family protein [Methylocystis parvus]QGM98159.1 histidine phosphotransferase [Methylocystis parvus]WBK01519.1 histidine phosphotransferase family protein [Methylocystis parvus OBBP]
MTQFSLDALDLAALLSSRVCHDVISPVGAIVNGLEVLEEEKDAEMRGHALALIKSSANEASARLQFCRLAFGAAGSKGASIDTGDAELVTRQLLADERTQLNWSIPRVLMSKNKVKLLLNLCLMADAAIPRGGVISVSATGEEEKVAFKIEAKGTNARIAANIPALLAGEAEDASIDARAIQPYYAGLVAKACGLDVTVSAEPELVTIEAKPAEAAGAGAGAPTQAPQSAVA